MAAKQWGELKDLQKVYIAEEYAVRIDDEGDLYRRILRLDHSKMIDRCIPYQMLQCNSSFDIVKDQANTDCNFLDLNTYYQEHNPNLARKNGHIDK